MADSKQSTSRGVESQGFSITLGDNNGVPDAVQDRPQDQGLLLKYSLCLDSLVHLGV